MLSTIANQVGGTDLVGVKYIQYNTGKKLKSRSAKYFMETLLDLLVLDYSEWFLFLYSYEEYSYTRHEAWTLYRNTKWYLALGV